MSKEVDECKEYVSDKIRKYVQNIEKDIYADTNKTEDEKENAIDLLYMVICGESSLIPFQSRQGGTQDDYRRT